MIRRPPRSTLDRSSAASDVYKRQGVAGLEQPLASARNLFRHGLSRCVEAHVERQDGGIARLHWCRRRANYHWPANVAGEPEVIVEPARAGDAELLEKAPIIQRLSLIHI